MKLSIVIVSYNVKHYLEQCLWSLRRACRGLDAEVWVVDNASTDGTVEIVEEYQTKYPQVSIKIYVNEKNSG